MADAGVSLFHVALRDGGFLFDEEEKVAAGSSSRRSADWHDFSRSWQSGRCCAVSIGYRSDTRRGARWWLAGMSSIFERRSRLLERASPFLKRANRYAAHISLTAAAHTNRADLLAVTDPGSSGNCFPRRRAASTSDKNSLTGAHLSMFFAGWAGAARQVQVFTGRSPATVPYRPGPVAPYMYMRNVVLGNEATTALVAIFMLCYMLVAVIF